MRGINNGLGLGLGLGLGFGLVLLVGFKLKVLVRDYSRVTGVVCFNFFLCWFFLN